jgi:uncharacterized membrane protein
MGKKEKLWHHQNCPFSRFFLTNKSYKIITPICHICFIKLEDVASKKSGLGTVLFATIAFQTMGVFFPGILNWWLRSAVSQKPFVDFPACNGRKYVDYQVDTHISIIVVPMNN